jgi:histone acetyltransferase MYST1
MTSTKKDREVEIGERYLVSWRSGQQHIGEVVEIRTAKRKHGTDSAEAEFYIHYPQFDRRLDEWVSLDRIDVHTIVAAASDQQETKHKKLKRRTDEEKHDEKDDKEVMLIALEKENDEITKVKNIQCIVLGKYEIETWYFSPYPEEYSGEEKMYICEYCLKYMKRQKTLVNHAFKCHMHSPPGRQIYCDDSLSMFEIDGKDHKLYCQNLCLLSKLFLDHKTLYYDVDPFLFYVLCEVDEHDQHHIVGYFSKEKQSQENYNLACILTFPPFQRKGYGKFLISVSYELTKREGSVGSPEKPLSDLGRISYRSYWANAILSIFRDREALKSISVDKITRLTGIRTEDILSTLHSLNMIKYWKGQHVISVNAAIVDNSLKETNRIRLCDPSCLTWQPPSKASRINKVIC